MTGAKIVPQPSSTKLKTDVANFMARADEICAHPLATHEPSFDVLLGFDPETMLVTSINIDLNHLDKATWVYLAVLMRPIVFNESDSISFTKLAGAMGREHELLRDRLKEGRSQFAQWQRHMFVGQQELGPVEEVHKGMTPDSVVRLEFGDVGTVPDSIDPDKMVPDYTLAKVYLNGMLWHSDTDKATEFQAATPHNQAFYAKCAEIRTITAIKYVRNLREFINQTRTAGFDF